MGSPIYWVGTKFFAFFFKFSFYFFSSRLQLTFNNVCSIAIYDLSQTLWQRKDPAFVEFLGLLAEEVDEVHFEVVLSSSNLFSRKWLDRERYKW